MKKSIFAVVIIALLGAASIGVAQSGWIGTGWISAGNTISSESLKSNLDYLFTTKAPKPQDCNGVNDFLGWENGAWTCQSNTAPANCTFNGTTVSNGDSLVAYASSNVAFGQSCQQQTRTCSNGVLSGTYQASGCSVVPASACVLDGETIVHDGSIVAYESETVASGDTCQAQTRTCSNGVLSGSYEQLSCVPAQPSTCVFDGAEVSNGESVTAYESETASFNSTCVQETRTCTDGTLSGSYEAANCSVSRQDPVTFRQSDFIESVTEELCRTPGFSLTVGLSGTPTYTPRINGGCPGLLSYEVERTTFYLQGNPGIQYTSRTGSGIGHDGLASNTNTLRALCELKGYQYVVGQAPRSGSGFRSFNSPDDNRLVYGTSGPSFSPSAVTINQTFNGQRGYVTCSNTQNAALDGGLNQNGGGGGGARTPDAPTQQF